MLRLCLEDQDFFMKGYEKTYTLVHDSHKKILCLMKEILPLKRPLKKLIPYKQEDSSNILVEKQVETYIHTHILYRVLVSIDCQKILHSKASVFRL